MEDEPKIAKASKREPTELELYKMAESFNESRRNRNKKMYNSADGSNTGKKSYMSVFK